MKHSKKYILLMDKEISNKHLLANIFLHFKDRERETNGHVTDGGRAENGTCVLTPR